MNVRRSPTLSIASALAVLTVMAIARVDGQAPPGPVRLKADTIGIGSVRLPPSREALRRTAVALAEAGQPDLAGSVQHRAILDQYCVPCHNDRTKTANLSLEKL